MDDVKKNVWETYEHWSQCLRCAICFCCLKDPHTLECGHTFCKKCLKRLASIEREDNPGVPRRRLILVCPSCRNMFPARPTLKGKTSTNISMQHMVEMWEKECEMLLQSSMVQLRSISTQTETPSSKHQLNNLPKLNVCANINLGNSRKLDTGELMETSNVIYCKLESGKSSHDDLSSRTSQLSVTSTVTPPTNSPPFNTPLVTTPPATISPSPILNTPATDITLSSFTPPADPSSMITQPSNCTTSPIINQPATIIPLSDLTPPSTVSLPSDNDQASIITKSSAIKQPSVVTQPTIAPPSVISEPSIITSPNVITLQSATSPSPVITPTSTNNTSTDMAPLCNTTSLPNITPPADIAPTNTPSSTNAPPADTNPPTTTTTPPPTKTPPPSLPSPKILDEISQLEFFDSVRPNKQYLEMLLKRVQEFYEDQEDDSMHTSKKQEDLSTRTSQTQRLSRRRSSVRQLTNQQVSTQPTTPRLSTPRPATPTPGLINTIPPTGVTATRPGGNSSSSETDASSSSNNSLSNNSNSDASLSEVFGRISMPDMHLRPDLTVGRVLLILLWCMYSVIIVAIADSLMPYITVATFFTFLLLLG